MTHTLISVVIPVYNGSRYLRACIDSALSQTYPHVEIVVVNDGSKDNSMEILKSYGGRILIIDQTNSGPAIARNNGVKASHGELVAFLDQDDVWDDIKLERQAALLNQHSNALATYCDHRGIDEHGVVTSPSGALHYPRTSGQILEHLIRGNFILSASLVMLRRSAFDAVGGFDASQPHWSDDYDLWMRIAARGAFLYQIETLAGYRRHSSNTSGSAYEMQVGNAHALRNLERHLNREQHQRLLPLLREERYQSTLGTAWHYRLQGRRKEAINTYLAAIALRPSCLPAWFGLMRALLISGGPKS
ncbi:glycosyl transferase [Sulfuricella denitrificans skB26]|uniref:Glycosyl transferase n=1 Tax=Sulfuricella denitrificans (strain DSM 22764 / NBRC 105220 / skB26) TaxID=1163617 RepID=S6B8X4_SULDS|nr:glycosyltransferase family A protein [Sulfuricella denitrificans]BAN36772.1 glycosyl transferase [Sulfuricella denitrificans skB26]